MRLIEFPSYARAKAKRLFRVAGILALFTLVAWLIGYLYEPARLYGYFIAIFSFAFTLQILSRALNAQQGQSGEDRTAKALSVLGDEYTLIRNLQLGEKQGDIDFVLLGPFGVLVLEQKANSVPMRCQGDKWSYRVSPTYWKPTKSYSRQLTKNVKAIQKLIKAPCYGTIVFNDGVDLTANEPTVAIIRRKELLNHIQNLPHGSCDANKLVDTLTNNVVARTQTPL